MTKVSSVTQKFFHSNKSKVGVVIVFSILGIVQLLIYGLGLSNNSIEVNSSKSWIVWTTITASTIASIFSILSTFFSISFSTKFFKYQIVSFIAFVSLDLLLFLWFDLVKQIMIMYIFTIRWIKWKNNETMKMDAPITPKVLETPKFIWLLCFAISLGGLLGFGMDSLNQLYATPDNPTPIDPSPYLDAMSTVLVLFGVYLMINLYYQAWFFCFLADLLFGINMLYLHQYSTTFMAFFYVCTDLLTIYVWRNLISLHKLNKI